MSKRNSPTCGPSCGAAYSHSDASREQRRLNNLAKHGVEFTTQREDVKKKASESLKGTAGRFGSEASKKAMREKLGVDNASQLESVKEAKKKSSLAKYGVDNPMKSKEVKEKLQATMMDRYGVGSVFQLPEAKERLEKVSLERYGVRHPMQSPDVKAKARATNMERYGAIHFSKTADFSEKVKATSLERYGTDHPMKSDVVKENLKAAIFARYGVDNAFSSEEIKKKIREKIKADYGVDFYSQSQEFKEKFRRTSLTKFGGPAPMSSAEVREKVQSTMMSLYGVEFALQHEEFKKKFLATYEANVKAGVHRGVGRISQLNRKFAKTIEEKFNVSVTLEKAVGPYAFDLFVDEANLLIDLNPTISHNSTIAFPCVVTSCELPCIKHSAVAKNYHFKRALEAKKNGYRLVQIFDWEDEDRVMAFLGGKLGSHFQKTSARACRLEKISQKDANVFLDEHHVQGRSRGQTHCYGLMKDGELLAVATFSKARFGASSAHEFNRYAVKANHIVHGASGKLFKAFVEEVEPESVVSYVDFNHTTGPTFLPTLGFEETRPTGATAVWHHVLDGRKFNETSILAVGADRLLKTAYGSLETSGLSNRQIMEAEGFVCVYTAGNRVFQWSRS